MALRTPTEHDRVRVAAGRSIFRCRHSSWTAHADYHGRQRDACLRPSRDAKRQSRYDTLLVRSPWPALSLGSGLYRRRFTDYSPCRVATHVRLSPCAGFHTLTSGRLSRIAPLVPELFPHVCPEPTVAEPCAAANCSARHAGCCGPSRRLRPSCHRRLSPATQPARRAPPSLSLGSLGDFAPRFCIRDDLRRVR